MNWFNKFFIVVIITSVIISFSVSVRAVNDLQTSIDQLARTLESIDAAMSGAYDKALNDAIPYAPSGYTIYQLRGNAQKEAQRLLDILTDRYGLPRYELTGIAFAGDLGFGRAALVPKCTTNAGQVETSFVISINEILFLRHYEDFLYIYIPHEVAHIATCLRGGFPIERGETLHAAAHGEEWLQSMKDLGFTEPETHIFHNLDMSPVYEYKLDMGKRLKEVF